MKILIVALLTGGSMIGCMVGPTYRTPTTTPPSQWQEVPGGTAAAAPPAAATWWKTFQDPELDSLVQRALKANLDLRIAEARVREARAQAGIQDAAAWPSLNASGSKIRERQSSNQPILGELLPPGTQTVSNAYQAGFDASWELDLFGAVRRGREAATARVQAAAYSREDVQVTLVAEVARTYAVARGFQQRLAIARDNIKAQQDIVALTRDRFHSGLTSSLEPDQAATVLAETEAQVPALETGLRTAVHHLGVLLGQAPGALTQELEAVAPIPQAPPQVPAGLPSDLLRRRPDIRGAERQLAAATADVGVATADLFPRFALTASAGYLSANSGSLFKNDSRTWSVGPTFQWRIFDAGAIRANIRVQNARQEQALVTYQKAVLSGFEDVEDALVAYSREQDRNRPLRQAVSTSASALEVSRQLYGNGLASFLNVLDAERSLYQAQDALVQSDQAVAQDYIALYKALGGGWLESPVAGG
jgi:NodT family efflux transporter outer membrane factor (OMF) lipoprotein